MASNGTQMNIVVGADTSGFKREIQGAKSAIKDFNKTADSSLSAIGNAFGINTQKVEQISNAIKGLGIEMGKSSSSGVKAFGQIATSIGAVGTALGAIGFAAAIAGFKALSAEANNFKSTIAGANIELQTQAYIGTYQQVFHDLQGAAGKSLAETGSTLRKTWTGIKTQAGAYAKAGITNLLGLTDISASDIQNQAVVALQNSKEAERIAGEIFSIQRQQKDNLVTISELDAKIAEAREKASSATASASEKLAASTQAQELIKQKYALQIPLQDRLAQLMQEMTNLASSTPDEIDQANAALIQANNLRAQEASDLRALNRQQGTLTKEVQKEAEAVKAIADSRASLASWNSSVSGTIANGTATTSMGKTSLEVPVTPKVDIEQWRMVGDELSSLLTSLTDSVGTSLGELVGDLATGGDAWGNFKTNAISAMGDMCVAVGKMAVATGVAALGIKKALESLNPWVAIGAGTALIALGSAVKAGLSNIASGNYSSASSVASSYSGGSSYSSGYASQSINVNVTGKLVAQGSTLAAVISNENKRINATT